jgi:hypothetical protein
VNLRRSLALAAPLIACMAGMSGALATAAAAKPGDVFPYPIHQTTLGNGFKIVVIPCDTPGMVAYSSVVRTGSRDEVEAGHSGFAHFFEHMMFRASSPSPSASTVTGNPATSRPRSDASRRRPLPRRRTSTGRTRGARRCSSPTTRPPFRP